MHLLFLNWKYFTNTWKKSITVKTKVKIPTLVPKYFGSKYNVYKTIADLYERWCFVNQF